LDKIPKFNAGKLPPVPKVQREININLQIKHKVLGVRLTNTMGLLMDDNTDKLPVASFCNKRTISMTHSQTPNLPLSHSHMGQLRQDGICGFISDPFRPFVSKQQFSSLGRLTSDAPKKLQMDICST
jgi:hypothetical protein